MIVNNFVKILKSTAATAETAATPATPATPATCAKQSNEMADFQIISKCTLTF